MAQACFDCNNPVVAGLADRPSRIKGLKIYLCKSCIQKREEL